MNKYNCVEEYEAVVDFCANIQEELKEYIVQQDKVKVNCFGNVCRLYELRLHGLDDPLEMLQAAQNSARIWHEENDSKSESEYKKMRDNYHADIPDCERAVREDYARQFDDPSYTF